MKKSTKTIITALPIVLLLSVPMMAYSKNAINDTEVYLHETEITASETVENAIPSAKDLAQNVMGACSDISSVRVMGTMEYAFDFGDSFSIIGAKTKYVSDIILEPYLLHMQSCSADSGLEVNDSADEITMESYVEQDENGLISYISIDEGKTWYKFTQGDSRFSKEFIDKNTMLSIMNETMNAEVSENMETIEDQNCYVLSVDIPFSDINEALESFQNSNLFNGVFGQIFERIGEGSYIQMVYWVSEDTFLPVKATMDMSEVMDQLLYEMLKQFGSIDNITFEASKMIVETTYSDYGTVGDVIIPDEARSAKAITLDEYASVFTGEFQKQ